MHKIHTFFRLKLNTKLLIDPPKKLTMAHLSPSVDRDRRPWQANYLPERYCTHRIKTDVDIESNDLTLRPSSNVFSYRLINERVVVCPMRLEH